MNETVPLTVLLYQRRGNRWVNVGRFSVVYARAMIARGVGGQLRIVEE